MSKWFVEVVKDDGGKYHANMMIDGKVVEGLVQDVDYNTLRTDIKEKTGIEIYKKKDMRFWTYDGKQYAILDFTREREDCRVSEYDVRFARPGWWPDFEGNSEWVGKQVVLGPVCSYVNGFDGIYVDIGKVVNHVPEIVGEMCGWAGSLTVHKTERLYLSGLWVVLDELQSYRDSLQLYSEDTGEVAREMLLALRNDAKVLQEMPLVKEPPSGGVNPFVSYLDFLDCSACSDEQLVVADMLAKKYIGPQAVVRKDIQLEMVQRFKERTTPSLEDKLANATQRSCVGDAESVVGTRNSELGTREGVVEF